MDDKIPPQNIEAEQSVLGAMMLSKDAITIVAARLLPESFYKPAHSYIFEAVVALHKKNQPVDLVTVSNQLKKDETLDKAGGRTYLADIVNAVPTAVNADKYAEIVLEKALLRQLIDAGSHIISEGYDDSVDVESVLENAQRNILDISKQQIQEDFVKIDKIMTNVFDDIQSVYGNDDKILGVPSGFPDLDTMTSGFQKSDLIILAARPSMGKTTLGLNFATNAAVVRNIPIAIFSLEMPKEQLALRLLSSESKLDSKRLRTANLHEHEYKNLVQALGQLSEAPIYIDDTPGLTPMELKSKVRRLQSQADIQMILIDYLQLMRSSRKRVENRFQEISEIVREVKGFAKEVGIPIMALSQLSRDVEKRPDKRPMLSDLRESGELEQTADLVLFIHRDDYYVGGTDPSAPESTAPVENKSVSITDIFIAKHRNGPTGKITLGFRRDISKFVSIDPAHGPKLAPVPDVVTT